jgi:catechol 2,3-dioxygenase
MTIISPALHHVTLRTSRLEEMIAWYGRLLGADVMFRNDVAAWMSNDEANHRIAFLAVPGLSDDPNKVQHNGLHHMAFEYASFGDLMESYARLSGDKVTPAFCLDHGMTISMYYKDPEENFVELQCDCFGDWKQSCEWMRTSPNFAANPIGTFFDPAAVLAAHRAGADFPTLHMDMRSGGFLPATVPNIGLPDQVQTRSSNMVGEGRYSAALLDASDPDSALTPLDVEQAADDRGAIKLATEEANVWLVENGVDQAILQVAKNGVGILSVQIRSV